MTDMTNPSIGTAAAPVAKWPIIWKFSLILAASAFAYTLILYFTGLYTSTGMSLLSIVITIVVLVFGLRRYRSLNNGTMPFGAAFLIGFMTCLISSVIHSTLNAAYLAFIDDSVLITLTDRSLAQLEQSPGMNPQMLETAEGIYKILFTPAGMFFIGIISGVLDGIIIALILAAILKRDPPVAG
jgi:hypothetical protein